MAASAHGRARIAVTLAAALAASVVLPLTAASATSATSSTRTAGAAPADPARCPTSTWPARTAWAPRATRRSKVWYTVADGVLSDTYAPTIDNTDVSTLQPDRHRRARFTDLQPRDMTYTRAAPTRPGWPAR